MITNLAVPMLTASFYTEPAANANLRVMQGFESQNAGLLAEVAGLTNVPTAITLPYMYVESECGKLDIRPKSSKGACGYMQIDGETATDTINREKARGRLGAAEIAFMRKYLGATLDTILRTKPQTSRISQAQLMKKEFNVFIATMFLGQLIDANTEDGVIRMDKVVVLYNRGVNSRPTGATAKDLQLWAIKKWPGSKGRITADYIAKLVGRNGLLQTYLNA